MAEDEGAKKTPSKSSKKRRLSNDYQTPEYITVDVSDANTTYENGKPMFTTYKITTETTLPNFSSKNFSVRRRYSEFVWLRDHIRQKMDEKGKRLTIADLPGNTISSFFGSGRFEPDFIEERRKGLEAFLQSVVNHPWARFEPGLHKFLEDQSFQCGEK